VSEPTASEAAPPPKGKAKGKGKLSGKKIAGLPAPVAIGALAALAALGFLWWRDRHAKTAGGSSSTTSSTATDAALLDQLEQQLSDLEAGQGGSGAGGGGVPVTTTPGTSTGPASTSSVTPVTSSTGTGHPVGPSTPAKPIRAPSGTKTSGIGITGATISCQPLQPPTAQHTYRFRVWTDVNTTIIHDSTSGGTSVSLSGLKAGTQYGWHVQAINAGGAGPWSQNVNFRTLSAKTITVKPATK
jgi:hypothetical protein